MNVYALLDCNNFYASCERVFQPRLQKKPLVILSNNDGCVIARSYEAKDLGIAMGIPLFKCEYLIKRHKVEICSANFALYADLSQRVMSILEKSSSSLEVYSIDEAFFLLGDSSESAISLFQKAESIKKRVEKEVGISVSIGFGTNKTLAKVANKMAKTKKSGVFSLFFGDDYEYAEAKIDYYLSDFLIEDVWGLGWNYCRLLKKHSIRTALDFKYADRRWVRQEMKVQGLRTCMELGGISCLELSPYSSEEEKDAKTIISSRSFGYRVRDLEVLKEAVANFVATAAYKMRRSNKTTRCIQVSLRGINKDSEAYNYKRNWHGTRAVDTIVLNSYTNSTAKLINAAHKIVEDNFDPRLYYKKAGVVFYGLKDASSIQIPLLSKQDNFIEDFYRNDKLNKLVDTINDNTGANTLYWASMGSPKAKNTKSWRAQQSYRSPCYTTEWSDLPLVS